MKPSSTPCLVAFGANQSDPLQTLHEAIDRLAGRGFEVQAVSSPRTTKPIGGPSNQPDFVNAAILAVTSATAESSLEALQTVERECGRIRQLRWGPRVIDLDLAIFGETILQTPSACIPHPRMTFRRFVLEPASQVAGFLREPVSGCTIDELLTSLNESRNLVVWWTRNKARAEAVGQLLEQELIADRRWKFVWQPSSLEIPELGGLVAAVSDEASFREHSPSAKLLVFEESDLLSIRQFVSGPYLNLPGETQQIWLELKAAIEAMA